MRAPLLVVLSGLLLSSVAEAQQSHPLVTAAPGAQRDPVPPNDSIIVKGAPLPTESEVRSLARAITPKVSFLDPLDRFQDSVCFGSVGLDRPVLEAIGDRLAQSAERAGLKLAGPGCKPNIVILFVDRVDAEIARLIRRRWWVFGNRSPSQIDMIVKERGPVRAWSNIEVKNADGESIDAGGILRRTTASNIISATRRDVIASIVLVQRSALFGKTVRQIGDYLAMRTLAGVRPERATGKDTILALFNEGVTSSPSEMTAFDRGYLKGLYSAQANQVASSMRATIVQTIFKEQHRAAK